MDGIRTCALAQLERVFEWVNFPKSHQVAISTFENHCLVGELTFGDPFQDSGVEGYLRYSASRTQLVHALPSAPPTPPLPVPTSASRRRSSSCPCRANSISSHSQETTQGQIDGFFSQLPLQCYLTEVASVGD